MIPWFYSMEEFTQFKNYKPKHRQKIIDDLKQKVHGQKQILDETCKAVRKHALGASRRIKRGDKHRATEEMMTVAFDLKNAEPVLSNYVNSLLLLRVYEIMHIDGYEDPSALPEAMSGIDYGLYSLSTEDELRTLLKQTTDPLAIIGIKLNE